MSAEREAKRAIRAEGIPLDVRRRVTARDKRRCRYCGQQCVSQKKQPHADDALTFDHVRPISAGGRSTDLNVVIACHWCNWTKGDLVLSNAQIKRLEALALTSNVQPARAMLLELRAAHFRANGISL